MTEDLDRALNNVATSFEPGDRVRVRTTEPHGVVWRTGIVEYEAGDNLYAVELDDSGNDNPAELGWGQFKTSDLRPLADNDQ